MVLSNILSKTKKSLVGTVKRVLTLTLFFLLLQSYLLNSLFNWLSKRKVLIKIKLAPIFLKIARFFAKLSNKLDRSSNTKTISQQEIIRLSLRNMGVKKTRSLITVGGMSIGIGAIVFLVSLGYGFQDLVISRVAKLEEMKQADVMPNAAGNLYLTDSSLNQFNDISRVENISPLISMVGRVNFKNSVTDVVVHGSTRDYLNNSAIKPTDGKLFDSNDVARTFEDEKEEGQVAGAQIQSYVLGQEIGMVNYDIDEGKWIKVRARANTVSAIVGYTRRQEGIQDGIEYWGEEYDSYDGVGNAGTSSDGQVLGKWIKTRVPIWDKTNCELNNPDCENKQYLIRRNDDKKQVWRNGYFGEVNMSIQSLPSSTQNLGLVLGDEDIATQSSNLRELEILLQEATASATEEKEIIPLGVKATKQAVINTAMAQILGADPDKIIGEKITLSFVIVGDLIPEKDNQKVESEPDEYTIVGVIPGEKNPVIWVPFIDLKSLGVERYSQIRIMVNDNSNLERVRKQVEALGYKTSSVADTVRSIESLFSNIRLLLALLGTVALAVASLGMFNTLTVSLLERTREVGVMKAMGMKSQEVSELFLTESMLMGFFGGVLGIFLGIVGGFLLGALLSAIAIFQSQGLIDISSLPISFIIIIVFLSLLVGFLTGIYPARRARNISALNALRYE